MDGWMEGWKTDMMGGWLAEWMDALPRGTTDNDNASSKEQDLVESGCRSLECCTGWWRFGSQPSKTPRSLRLPELILDFEPQSRP